MREANNKQLPTRDYMQAEMWERAEDRLYWAQRECMAGRGLAVDPSGVDSSRARFVLDSVVELHATMAKQLEELDQAIAQYRRAVDRGYQDSFARVFDEYWAEAYKSEKVS